MKQVKSLGRKIIRSNDPAKLSSLDEFIPKKIRNFGIVAHVDHGKSTLADRILQLANVVDSNIKISQVLDKLQIEKERGITVKAQTCSMIYKDYLINLIDTPGHVDFSFEVARSLAACNGIVLLVAANQGVQAQTISNFWLAFERDLSMIPVINKVDLKTANVKKVQNELKLLFDIDEKEIIHVSAKSGLNVSNVLDTIIDRLPSPSGNREAPFEGLIFDSWYEQFRGAIPLILVKNGSISKGQKIHSLNNNKSYEVVEVGVMHPDMVPCQALYAGQVGYIICNMKTVKEATIGETLFDPTSPEPIKNIEVFKPIKPTIYAGLYPVETSNYENLKLAVERLCLNDPSVTITTDSSPALGLGWKVGFLGFLHMEVFSARLNQEYDENVILTAPNVEFKAEIIDNETVRKKRYKGQGVVTIMDVSTFPEHTDVKRFLEPMINLTILVPNEYMSTINLICYEKRGKKGEVKSIDEDRMLIIWRMPLAEVVTGFFEKIKYLTSGYASFDYELDGYDEIQLTKLGISINDKEINEFSLVVPLPMAKNRAKVIVNKLKEEIPKQQYEVNIKATLGNSTKPVYNATIKPWKKDFTQLLKGNFGGGGMERLNKKLSHQKKGKEKMKNLGKIQVPKDAFINVLKNTDNF
ncbi:Translation factor waclaw, mitochondrial [Strongyloides ratti]|uniref:Translation factor GUF1 homolog, mitochondrial n=1 Tax=Strongyloides ratti TaxID=34506 RepID=A0A090KWJ2_STRRB|nr:Translation factor waclaw, mitochondrial [Strongyloides ratti]CEF61880.1 Translation factor waclaw, mitochondrial [Strongyloides ratti]